MSELKRRRLNIQTNISPRQPMLLQNISRKILKGIKSCIQKDLNGLYIYVRMSARAHVCVCGSTCF